MQVEKYIKDEKVAILYSPRSGAGWSTWNVPEVAFDKRVVEFWLNAQKNKAYMHRVSTPGTPEEKEAVELFRSWGYDFAYFGGFEDVKLEWLPVGTKYNIFEHFGSEFIFIPDEAEWLIA